MESPEPLRSLSMFSKSDFRYVIWEISHKIVCFVLSSEDCFGCLYTTSQIWTIPVTPDQVYRVNIDSVLSF